MKKHNEGKYKRYLDTNDGVSPLLFPPSNEVIKCNSYEHDEYGITTEDAHVIAKMHEKRYKKVDALLEYLKDTKTVNIIRGEHPTNIFAYGSTYLSVLEALRYGKLNPTTVQPIFLSPLPTWELKEFKNQDNIVVEQSISGQFTKLLTEKAGLKVKKTIKRYDGRPFDPIELSQQIKEALK